jgi:hypothetical protein
MLMAFSKVRLAAVRRGGNAYPRAVNAVDDLVGIKQTNELTAWINFALIPLPLGGWTAGVRAADLSPRSC